MIKIMLENYYKLKEVEGFINDGYMYDLKSSLRDSGLPMRTKFLEEEDEVKMLNRMKRLCNHAIGVGENNFLKSVHINLTLTATIKFWTEWERYVFSPISSSSSTQHKIMNFELDGFIEDVDKDVLIAWEKVRDNYNQHKTKENYLKVLYSCPTGLKLTARVTFSMMSARNMYGQRRNHRLYEWRNFCNWMYEEIPYFKELTGIKEEMVEDDK